MLLVLFLFVFIKINEASFGMMVYQGAMMDCSNTAISYRKTWKDCIVSCAKNETCGVAQTITGKPSVCYTCAIFEIRNISRVYEIETQIALKNSNINGKDCGSLNNGTFKGSFNNTSNLTRYTYSIDSSVIGSSWGFSQSTSKICPINWEYFNRTRGGWCIHVTSGYFITREEAVEQCKRSGATLSGLESEEEKLYTYNTAKTTSLASLPRIWIDGIRRKGCQLTNVKGVFPQGCDSFNGFNFTDTLMSKTDGFTWEENNPDGLFDAATNSYQDCLIMWIHPNDMLIDDDFCHLKEVIQGFVCGKPAG